MKKLFSILVALVATNILSIRAEVSTEVHRFATYNVRYTNDASDTEANGRAWPARSQYVYNIIRDYKFDVMGLEEVTGRSGSTGVVINPSTGLSQREELQKELSEYSFLLFERDGSTKDYSYNAIAYRTSKYDLLDHGVFWLSPTPETPSVGWNTSNTINRTCGWAKLASKSTGEVFFYFVTHANYAGTIDGTNQAELICRKIDAIAGSNPVILCGDFNMSRTRHETSYRIYASNLDNTRFIADEFLCVPESNGQTTLTTTEWTPLTPDNASSISGNEFDYIFSRHMQVLRHNTITENYGRSTNPSDHYALLSICQLITNDVAQNLYVDSRAQAGGDGTAEAPFRSITEAVSNSRQGDTIRVAEGVYAESLTLPRSLVLLGGYDAEFTSVIGKSTLSGATGLNRLVNIPQYASLFMSDFVVRDAASASRDTDGAVYINGSSIEFVNVDLMQNSANNIGGALYAVCSDLILRQCRFVGNSAQASGGGAYVEALGDVLLEDCLFESNSAKSGSALQLADAASLTMMRNTVSANDATQYGTLWLTPVSEDFAAYLVDNTIVNNRLTSPSALAAVTRVFGGSALYAKLADGMKLCMAHNTVVGNQATFAGSNKANYGASALNVYAGSLILMNNIVAGNQSDSGRGDLYADSNTAFTKEQYNLLTCASSVSFTPSATDFTAATVGEGMSALADCLDGSLTDGGSFVARPADNGGLTATVAVLNPVYAGVAVNVLTSNLRLVETSFGLDLNGDGRLLGAWSTDQRGASREAASVPGACEVVQRSGLTDVGTAVPRLYSLGGNRFAFSSDPGRVMVCSLGGGMVRSAQLGSTSAVLDLEGLTCGIYLVRCSQSATTFKVLVR